MNCKIYYLQDKDVSQQLLSSLPFQNFKIITDDLNIKNSLRKLNYCCDELSELFPNVNPITFEIFNSASKLIKQYKEQLNKICFLNIPIFEILEPTLRDDFVLYYKILHILEKKENIIFLFKKNSHILFLINNMAKQFGYELEENDLINTIVNEKIHQISNFKEKKSLKTRLYLTLKTKSKETIFKLIQSEIQKLNISSNCSMVFFTPSTKYVLKPIFSVIEEFKKNSSPCFLFSFDHALTKEFHYENFNIIDFSRQALLLGTVIEKSSKGKQLLNEFLSTSKINNLEIIVQNGKINQKIYSLFRFLAMFQISQKIFQLSNPKSIILAFDGNSMGNSTALAAKSQSVHTYSICSLYILPHSLMKMNFSADTILVYGTHGRDNLLKLGFSPKKIIMTGNLMYDYMKSIVPKNAREEINEKFKIKENAPLILLGCGRWQPNDDIWLSKLIKFCNKQNFQLIIKVHPIYLTTQKEIHEQIEQKIKTNCQNLTYFIDFNTNTSILLPAADIVITDETNLGIESGLLGKPWITINFTKKDENFLSKISEHLANSIHLTNYDDLEKNILEIISGKKTQEYFIHQKNLLEKKFNLNPNISSSEKIFSILNDDQL